MKSTGQGGRVCGLPPIHNFLKEEYKMSNYIKLKEEELEQMIELRNQYEKEVADLTNGTGLARLMAAQEIRSAKATLAEHINELTENILAVELEIEMLKKKQDE